MSIMTNPEQSDFSSQLWQSIEAHEERATIELDADYVLVEEYNAALLRQVAGLERPNLTYLGLANGEETENSPPILGPPTYARLYMRPDREAELIEQGEAPLLAFREGSPYTIEGDIPKKTQEALGRMLGSIEAEYDETASTPTTHIWHGNVAGQPIIIQQISHTKLVTVDNHEKRTTVTSMTAVREAAPTVTTPEIEPRMNKLLRWIKASKRNS